MQGNFLVLNFFFAPTHFLKSPTWGKVKHGGNGEMVVFFVFGLVALLFGTGSTCICYYWKLLYYYYYLLFVICYYLLLFYVHATAGSSLTFILVISSCCFVKNLNCWFFIKFVSLVLLWDDDCKEVCETWIVLFCCSFYWNLDGLLSLWMGQDEKAVLFGRRKKKSQMWNGRNTTITNWQGKTYCLSSSSHLTRPTCWCRH